MTFIPVKDKKNLYRDLNSNAIINTDKSSYNSYLKLKEQKIKENEKVEKLNNEIETIKDDLKELKTLIYKLVENK
jgi:hypothetical protein